jgi:hypothetical protein
MTFKSALPCILFSYVSKRFLTLSDFFLFKLLAITYVYRYRQGNEHTNTRTNTFLVTR